MKIIDRLMLILPFFFVVTPASAAVMGEKDDRIEMYELPADWKAAAEGTLAIAPASRVVLVNRQWKTFTGNFTLATNPEYRPTIHPEYRFANQGSIADCSGFLVNADTMVTAAHCLYDGAGMINLSYQMVVAGMGYSSPEVLKTTPLMIPLASDHVAQIDKILYAGKPTLNGEISDTDFAILKLKAPLFNIKPLALKKNFSGDYKTPIALMGHPIGLPLKADLSGKVVTKTDATQKLMLTFLDSAQGNSGGPVFDSASRAVVGILVSGGKDWMDCAPPPGWDHAQYLCEVWRFETVDQMEKEGSVPRKLVAQFRVKYPSGIITAWASRVVRVEQIAAKLAELGIPYTEL